MAESEAGWTTERPDQNGIYWFKQSGMLPEALFVHGGFVYDFGDKEPTSIGFYDGRGEWLGPLYASDAEQLSELRRACQGALELQTEVSQMLRRWAEDAPRSALTEPMIAHAERIAKASRGLRVALAPKQQEGKETR